MKTCDNGCKIGEFAGLFNRRSRSPTSTVDPEEKSPYSSNLGDFTLVLLTSFIVKVSGHFIAVNNEKMDESTAVDNCGILQDIQRSICAQLDHNFYRFDTRVKNPIYLQCMIRNLSSNKNTVQLEVWLARQFVHLRCAQDTDSCAVHFVRKMILSPPENPPVLPYTLELDAHRMEISVLYNGRMNTAGCQLRTRFQHVLSFVLLSLLLISDN
ncbi:hypothetical protein FGIG_00480 [Fasciola gigantica]|uniref:Uncharacterized protein n=1 Tax=Fasciola gigantica TaxID=46835 RepID=A0A504YMZ7_FASGI|nr:hypothetical protein FGIG_00480 [Fasciola gigantica]